MSQSKVYLSNSNQLQNRPLLIRTNLFNKLDAIRHCAVTWLSGPPGSGKSTLIESYIVNRNIKGMWYKLDKFDNDPATFFYYLGLVAGKEKSASQKPLPLLTPEYMANLETFSQVYFRQFVQIIPSPFTLILDNYNALDTHSVIHDIVVSAIAEFQGHCNIIIISRGSIPIQMSRIHANQTLVQIDSDELKFDETELRRLIHLKGIKISATEDVKKLNNKLDGWITGLLLTLEHYNSGPLLTEKVIDLSANDLFNYFACEIFIKLNFVVRKLLLNTSFIPYMNLSIAAEMCPFIDVKSELMKLIQNHSFIEQRSNGDNYYQYHPMFRKFLISCAHEEYSQHEIIELQNKAAMLLEKYGSTEEAASLFVKTKAWDKFEKIICENAAQMLHQGRGLTIQNLLGNVPEEIGQHPWLQYWRSMSILPYDPIKARMGFEKSYLRFKTSTNEKEGLLLSWCGIVDTYLHEWKDFAPLDKWILEMEQILHANPDFPNPAIQAHVVSDMFSALVFRSPNHKSFKYWENAVRQILKLNLDIHHRIMIANNLVLYYTWIADLPKIKITIETLKPVIQSSEVSPLALIVWYSMEAMYAWLTLDVAKCKNFVNEGLELAQSSGIHVWDVMLLAQGCYGTLSLENSQQAKQYLDRMIPMINNSRFLDMAHYHYLAAWHCLLTDKLLDAKEHVIQALEMAQDAGTPFPQALVYMGLAQIEFDLGYRDLARVHLNEAMIIGRDFGSNHIEHHRLLLEAMFSLKSGNTELGLKYLAEGFGFARRHGYYNITWWRPKEMAELCKIALMHKIEHDYTVDLIKKHNLVPEHFGIDAEEWPKVFRIYTLGRFSMVKNGESIVFPGKAKSKPLEMLKTIIALGGRDVNEDVIVEYLWPNSDGDAAHQAFDTTLYRLRKLLGSEQIISLQNHRIEINPCLCWIDVWSVETSISKLDALLQKNIRNTNQIKILADKIMFLYKGNFLANDVNQAWTIELRDRIRSKFIRAVQKLGNYFVHRKNYDEAIQYYQKGLEIDNLVESFYQGLMQCYIDMDCTADAILVFHRCEVTFLQVLGIKPNTVTLSIYEKCL